jgi:hypothetical protein
VGVVPNDGVGAHEVVITKAFEHDGQYPWYEMIESYNGPQRRYFLSAGELNTMLLQNGVVFRREPGSTVPLLR